MGIKMKKSMEEFILKNYPNAILDRYVESKWGKEYLFYPDKDAEDCFDCVLENGQLKILEDF